MRKILIIFLLMTFCTRVFGDTEASEDAIKAAFIYHFISFTEWDDNDQNYYVCIPDDATLRETAREIFKGKSIKDHGIVVSNQSVGCHVLVSDNVPSTNSTMTIGPLSRGALFEFRLIDNKMKFAADFDKVKRFKFKISSQLLKLAILENGSS